MKILLQRVDRASVGVDGETVAAIGPGLCVFLGVGREDTEQDGAFLADKLLNLRIFPDESGKFSLSVVDTGGEILVVSQFTLYGDTRKGRRPSLTEAADPEAAERLYRDFVDRLTVPGGPRVCTGTFQAYMKVSLVNDGPVTFLIDSAEARKKTMNVVLYEPEIPPNTGSVARLCAATRTALHLVEPLGFEIDDKHLKRAGLDYWPHVDLRVHASWEEFTACHRRARLHFFSKKAAKSYISARFHEDDFLIFGPETRGLPESLLAANEADSYVIPMMSPAVRSLNLANAVSIVLYEGLRQLGKL